MSAALTRSTPTVSGWPTPPAYAPQSPSTALSREDRTVLLTMHAMVAFGLIISIPLIPPTADVAVFLDLGVAAFIALPGVLLAAFRAPGNAWWAVAGPLVTAMYLWLPSVTYGSIYADAQLVSVVALIVFAPLLQVIAPMVLLGRAQASARVLVLYGFGVVAAPAVVYASLAYPLAT